MQIKLNHIIQTLIAIKINLLKYPTNHIMSSRFCEVIWWMFSHLLLSFSILYCRESLLWTYLDPLTIFLHKPFYLLAFTIWEENGNNLFNSQTYSLSNKWINIFDLVGHTPKGWWTITWNDLPRLFLLLKKCNKWSIICKSLMK